jgi:hypothetical protein
MRIALSLLLPVYLLTAYAPEARAAKVIVPPGTVITVSKGSNHHLHRVFLGFIGQELTPSKGSPQATEYRLTEPGKYRLFGGKWKNFTGDTYVVQHRAPQVTIREQAPAP